MFSVTGKTKLFYLGQNYPQEYGEIQLNSNYMYYLCYSYAFFRAISYVKSIIRANHLSKIVIKGSKEFEKAK